MPADSKIPYLPEPIAGLERLALNLWWRWDRRARLLFRSIDPAIWSATRHNPVAMLRMVDPNRLAQLSRDKKFVAEYHAVLEGLDQALDPSASWFRTTYPDLDGTCFAYFCAEFGLHNSIPIYSGGLGILAGDHCKGASDLGVPLVGVGLLYSKGYFDQKLNHDGWQEDSDEPFDPRIMPLVRLQGADDDYRITVVNMSGRPVHIGAWKLNVGRVSLYLLDTNLPENDAGDRELTYKLYGGGHEHRLRQEWILGVGGVRVLRALGVSPGVWHANEGHATFMMVERVREHVEQGVGFEEAVARVRSSSVFTTHTPVPAGHDVFYPDLIDEVCGDYFESSVIDREAFMGFGRHPNMGHGAFHMTGAALRLARHLNGVSKIHGALTQELWTPLWPDRDGVDVPISSITNGVHVASWMAEQLMQLLDETFGPYWEKDPPEGSTWDRITEIDDARLWDLHYQLKTSLLGFCRELARDRWKTLKDAPHLVGAGTLLSPGPLTIGFARRFAQYKRASLLFRDEGRLRRLLTNRHRPVQLVFSGKAHPADNDSKHILQRVWRATRDPGYEGRIAFVEDYDVHVAHRLVQGVDLWLNLPKVPLEACGTSGMKAALNFVPQLSTLDGWWAEGFNGDNGWAIPNSEEEEGDARDEADHDALFTLLEREVATMYYERDERDVPVAWVARMKQAMIVAGKTFTTRRMVKEYADRFYVPALRGGGAPDDPPTDAPIAAEEKPGLTARA